MKRNILLIILLLVVVAAGVGAYLYSKKTPDVVQDKPEAVVTTSALLAAFAKDTAAARLQYIDKVVEVSGTVKKIDSTGSIILGEEGSGSEVIIGLDRRHMDDVKKVQVGQPTVVQGICSAYTTSGSSDPTDLLASLGSTVELRSAGIKEKK